MKVVFLYGPPACGKMTVGRELAALTGWRLVHHHLAADLAKAVFGFGAPEFAGLREKVWLDTFYAAAEARLPGLIFTFQPEPTVSGDFPERVAAIAEAAGGEATFVALSAPRDVLEERIGDPARAAFGKLNDVETFRAMAQAGAWAVDHMPHTELAIDTSLHQPDAAAKMIHAAVS